MDAGARRYGSCLQSSFKRVRLPPASLGKRQEEIQAAVDSSGPAAHAWPSVRRFGSCVPDMGSDDDDVVTVSSEGEHQTDRSGSRGFDSRTDHDSRLVTDRALKASTRTARGRRAYRSVRQRLVRRGPRAGFSRLAHAGRETCLPAARNRPRWQHQQVPCSARIPLSPAVGRRPPTPARP